MKSPLILFIIILLFSSALQAEVALLINSYHVGHSGSDLRVSGFKKRFLSNHELHEIYMNTKRKSPNKFSSIADRAWSNYQNLKPDVVILNDDNALRLLGVRISNTGTPVVYMGINNNPRLYFGGVIPNNVIGVLERHLIVPLVRHFTTFVPMKNKRVLILFDESITSNAIIDISLYGKTQLIVKGITVDIQKHTLADDYINAAIKASKDYDFTVLDTFYTLKTSTGELVTGNEILSAINRSSKIPMFSVTDYAVGENAAVGSMFMSMEKHGADAAELTVEILESGKFQSQYHSTKSDTFVFNKSMLKRFNLTLPPELIDQAIYR